MMAANDLLTRKGFLHMYISTSTEELHNILYLNSEYIECLGYHILRFGGAIVERNDIK